MKRKTNDSMLGVEYINEDLTKHPECVHGPTFLFERTSAKDKRFFACSASRDRKECPFFLLESDIDKINTETAKEALKKKKLAYAADINHKKLLSILTEITNLPENERYYCLICNKFLVESMKESHDTSHKQINGISDTQLKFPTKLLPPLENDKIEAQYLFDESAIKTTIDIIREFEFKNILCIGTPRIFEHIKSNCGDIKCFLLDFDRRYHNFFEPNEFAWYNLFNNYFFFDRSRNKLTKFLKRDNGEHTLLLIDPPFGGRLEPISNTIRSIENELQTLNSTTKPIPVIFYFPYFMEQHFKNHLPDLKMTDYKVNYENHYLFSDSTKGRKYGSAVRIFTNLDFKRLKFDGDEYRYCMVCERYVYKENSHCYLCNACTSKDGRTYIHCNACNRCVKPTWKHCKKCKKCAQPDHKCGEIEFSQSCFHCHEKGHKKNECPKVNVSEIKRKRKETNLKMKKLKSN